MALHFVSTSILTSVDGLSFDKEEAIESEDTKRAKKISEQQSKRPLFEQLADQKNKKQEEYDSITKLIFAPPPSLKEDDYQFFQDMDNSKSKVLAMRSNADKVALEQFRAARQDGAKHLEQNSQHTKFGNIVISPKILEVSSTLPTIVKRKREKASDTRQQSTNNDQQPILNHKQSDTVIATDNRHCETVTDSKPQSGAGSSSSSTASVSAAMLGLNGYASDSD